MSSENDLGSPDPDDLPLTGDAGISPEDERFVRAALADLPPLTMPANVSTKLMSALSAESLARQQAWGITQGDQAAGIAPVVELASRRKSRAWLGVAAGAAAACAIAVVAIGSLGTTNSATPGSGDNASVIPETTEVPMTMSQVSYSHPDLNTQATTQLVTGKPVTEHIGSAKSAGALEPPTPTAQTSAPSSPVGVPHEVLAATPFATSEGVQSCLVGLSRKDSVIWRVDLAKYKATAAAVARPAAAIYLRGLRNNADPNPDQVELFVVSMTCRADQPGLLDHAVVTAPR